MRSRQLLLYSIKQLLTLRGGSLPRTGPAMRELGIIENAAVLVEDDTILWVGPQRELDRSLLKEPHEIDCSPYVVLPGLIDCHTHAMFAGSREDEFAMRTEGASYQEIAAAGGGILSTVRATREATKKELKRLTSHRLDGMLRHGTTTAEVKSGYGLSNEEGVKMLDGLREMQSEQTVTIVPTFLGAHAIPPEYPDDPRGYVDLLTREVLPYVSRRKLARFADIFCETGYFNIDQTRAYLTKAKELGFTLRMHADQLNAIGATALGAELGAATMDHLERIDKSGIGAMKKAGTIAVLLPGSTFFLGGPYAPAREIIDAGVPVAVASNFNPGSSMSYSLPMMMTIACTQMRMTPDECITATTANAAAALGLAAEVGTIEPGKKADLAIFDVSSYKTIPYHFAENHVAFAVKRGIKYETRG